MTATDELRRMLDERGVKWGELVGHPVVVGTEWHDSDGYPCTALEHAYDVPDEMLSVQANLTPEQAIEATLGRGTCHINDGECDKCGAIIREKAVTFLTPTRPGIRMVEKYDASYCPNCGRRVVAGEDE